MSLRALGGAPLEGVGVPRILYVDEAGIGDPADEPYLVVVGLFVHMDIQLNKLYREIEAVDELAPIEFRERGGVLHPAMIYGSNGRFDEKRHPEWAGKRMPILEALAQIPNKANISIASSYVRRNDFPLDGLDLPGRQGKSESRRPASKTVTAHATAYMACLLEADVYLRLYKKNENCMVVVEDNEQARSAIRAVHRHHQDKSLAQLLPEDVKSHFPLRRIREDPSFQEKRPGHPLILADFVAFIFKRVLMKDTNALPLFEPWRKRLAALSLSQSSLLPK